jgi:hypothetical protein
MIQEQPVVRDLRTTGKQESEGAMTPETFLELLEQAELNPYQAASWGDGVSFGVCLHYQTAWGLRCQCDMLTYDIVTFAKMSKRSAKVEIEAEYQRLLRAAKSQQGVIK